MHTSTTTLMQRTQTMILAGGRGERLSPLTMFRPKAALPFGGVFRIVDFTLSNCFNSRLGRVALLTQYRHEQLQRYVRERWSDQVLCLPPKSGKHYRGTADALYQNLECMRSQGSEYMLVLSADHVYEMDYGDLIARHVEAGAEVTIAAVEQRHMGVYVFSAGTLERALNESRARSGHDLGRDVLPALVDSARVHTYHFPGYWREIKTLDDYYAANMDLLQPEPLFKPFAGNACGKASLFSGARVSQSVLSFGVCIERDARIENSVLMPGVQVGRGVRLRRAIVEEGVRLPDGYQVGWHADEDVRHHMVSASGIVVITQTPVITRPRINFYRRPRYDTLQRAA